MMRSAIEFSLPNQDGETVTQADFLGRKYILFFYPRAMTPGCTTESCDFRDGYEEFRTAGYDILGVSPDAPDRNKKFKEMERLTFDLLSDEDNTFSMAMGAYGEKKLYGKVSKGLIRSTFIIDEDGMVEREFRNVKATGHVARLKAELLG